jgi:hypothetical protein
MPRGVVNLVACWRARGGRSQLDAVWNMITHCLCGVYGGKNNRESTLVELKPLFFKALFLWAADSYSSFSHFHVVLDLLSASS